LNRLLPAIVVAAACAFCPLAQSQPKKEFVDAFVAAFRHFLAITTVGVEACGDRFPKKKDGYVGAFERTRYDNLDVIAQAEASADFAAFVEDERSRALAETPEVMAEYCSELPRFIGVVAEYAYRLRLVLAGPVSP
jgi:hypothetical protein